MKRHHDESPPDENPPDESPHDESPPDESLTDPPPETHLAVTDRKPQQKRKRVKSADAKTDDLCDTKISGNPTDDPLINIPQKPEPVTEEKLRNFVLFKAFDIIGEGGYRRFVLKNKNNGEQWATGIYNDSHAASKFLRSTLQLTSQLSGNVPCAKLHKLCQRVTNDMNPPSISTHGWCICALTGMRTENTTQLGRSNKGEVCYVHRKFHKFFSMLWFVARFELCIKYATMQWLQHNNGNTTQNIQVLCEKLQNDTSFTKNICQSILHATQHVADSVIMHIKHTGRGTMLNIDP
jgi:hypothetical protein